MKNAFLMGALVVSAVNASALVCNTNITSETRQANTSVSAKARGNSASISIVTSGGMAHFITAPRNFVATVTHVGPEVVEYKNEQEGFELTVNAQPIGGQIHGTLTETLEGSSYDYPVVCK